VTFRACYWHNISSYYKEKAALANIALIIEWTLATSCFTYDSIRLVIKKWKIRKQDIEEEMVVNFF
jgi:hypothetical protein